MTHKIYLFAAARMGNAIFRYLAGVLFCILYGFRLSDDDSDLQETVDDTFFLRWMNEYNKTGVLPAFDTNKNYKFYGYFQHDTVYLKHKEEILQYIRENPEYVLRGDNGQSIRAIDLLDPVIDGSDIPSYDLVLHLRLEDFIVIGFAINPDVIRSFLNNLKEKGQSSSTLTIVVKQPTSQMEVKYIEYVTQDWKSSGSTVIIESNSYMKDFHIMKNARALICSCSTFCWSAALLSDCLETAYMPNVHHPDRIWETFRRPVEDTRPCYPNMECSIYKLGQVLGVKVPLPRTRRTTRIRELLR